MTSSKKQVFDLGKNLDPKGTYIGRVWNPAVSGPSVIVVREGRVIDITLKVAPSFVTYWKWIIRLNTSIR